MAADPNRTILTGENPFIRLSATNGGTITTNASYWRIITCPAGPGHVLYLKSELTENRWLIYSDNIAMARWLQSTVQGMLNPETADTSIPVVDAAFSKEGDPRYFWTERIDTAREDLTLTWYEIGEPLLIHTNPGEGGRKYGVDAIFAAPLARVRVNEQRLADLVPGPRGVDALGPEIARVALLAEGRVNNRDRRVGGLRVEHALHGRLQPAGHRDVVGINEPA